MQEHMPGQVITPSSDPAGVAPPATLPPVPPSAVPAESSSPAPSSSAPHAQDEQPRIPDLPPTSSSQPTMAGVISWEADEFLAHEKSGAWYSGVVGVSIIIAGLVYFLNKDIITAVLVLVALCGLAAFGGRRPRRQRFDVAPEGIQVGKMFYPFADFRCFAVVEEKNGHNLVLISLKRFVPAINIYIPEAYEQEVVDLVASVLPLEPHTPDFIERLMARIHF